MKRANIFQIILILFITSSMMYGQRIFRPIDPSNPYARYGKSPYSGPPFLYFGSTSHDYHIAHSQYNNFISDVDAAFTSWNNAGPTQFSRTTSNGLTLTAEAQDYGSNGPAWSFPSWSGSTYELTPSSASIVLNTSNTTWSNIEQHLNASPHVLDVQTMVVHEAGHIMGLAHPLTGSYTHDATAPTMAGGDNEYFDNTLECRSLETDDIDAVIFLQLRVPSLYSSLQTALSTASGIGVGYVYLTQNYTLSSNQTVASGVTLIINSGVTLNLNSYSVISTGGTIVNNGATINGYRAIVKSGNDIKGIYPTSYTVQQLIDLCSSGWSINLVSGTYTENLNMKAGVTVNGSGSGTTTINGTVTFDNDSYASLTNCTVNNKITILSNSSGVTLSDITAGSSSCYLDVTGQSAYVNNFNSGYSQSYSVWVNNASLFTMGLGSLTNKYNALIVDYSTSGYTNSVNFCENTRDILAGFESGSVSATECSFSSSTEGSSVQGNVTWDYWNYCGGSFSMILGKSSGTLNTSPDYDIALEKYAMLMDEIRKGRKTKIDLGPKNYKEVFTKVIEEFRSIIRNKPASNEAKPSIGHIASIYRMLDEYEMLENFADEIINDSQKESLRYYVLRALVLSYINQNKFTHAIELTDQIISEYPNDSSVIEMIYSKGLVYKYYLKDEEKAKEMFEEVIIKDSEHVAAVFSRAELETLGKEFRSNKLLSSEFSKEIELRNYPNPFNPETKIKYSIPETGLVTIKVYDMLGKEIATLVNERKSSGTHEVKFNGSELPSGIYFYSINHGKQRLTGKMMLLK